MINLNPYHKLFPEKNPSRLIRLILVIGLLGALNSCGPPYEVVKGDFRTLRDNRSTKKYTKKWKKVNNAREIEEYKRALRLTKRIFKKANRQNNPLQEVKALIILHKLRSKVSRLKPDFVFKNLKNLAKRKDFLRSSLGYAMLAERYQEAYQRIPSIITAKNTPLFDNPLIATWSRHKFRQVINNAWEQALRPREKLSRLYSGIFDNLTEGDTSLRSYRPSLFDLLAYKAIAYYKKGDGASYSKAITFQKGLFSLPKTFQRVNFNKLRGDSAYAKCIKLYQDINHFHLRDSVHSALAHVTLERLRFAYKHVALPEKKRALLYYQGIDSLIQNYPETPVKAMALFRKAQLLNQGVEPPGNNVFSLKALAVSLCKKTIKKYPGSAGAQRCDTLLTHIQKPSLKLKVQKRYLPLQPGRMRLEYQNMDSLFYQFVPIAPTLRPHLKRLKPAKLLAKLQDIPPDYQLNQALPLYTIYNPSSKNIGVPALEAGSYAVIASNNRNFSLKKGLVDIRFFAVSEMALTPVFTRSNGSTFRVVNAGHGKPVPNVLVKAYKAADKQRLVSLKQEYEPDSQGRVFIRDRKPKPDFLACIQDQDTLLLAYSNLAHSAKTKSLATKKTFHINKSVFKPGEQVIINGLLKSHFYHPIAAYGARDPGKFPVHLVGPSKDTLKTLSIKVSGSGLFQDSLKLPLLPGRYQILTSFQKSKIVVKLEPSSPFQLKLESGGAYFPLNDTVELKGSATALSAIPLPSQKVSFRVWRSVYFPYTTRPDSLPPFATRLVKEAVTKTDTNGNFQLHFETQIWPGMESFKGAVFNYKVVATLEQEQGPDLKASSTLKATKQMHYLRLHCPRWINKQQQLKPIVIESRTLNGTLVKEPLEVKLFRLKYPPQLYRKQYWQPPQFQGSSSKAFKLKFPFDPYGKKPVSLNHQPVADTVWQGSIPANKKWYLPDSIALNLKTGTYRIKLICKSEDSFSHTTQTSNFNLYSSDSQKSALKVFQYIAPSIKKVKTEPKCRVFIGSASRNTQIYSSISNKAGLQKDTSLRISNGQQSLKFSSVKEQPIAVTATSVIHNRLYLDKAIVLDQEKSKRIYGLYHEIKDQYKTGTFNSGPSNFGAFGLAAPVIKGNPQIPTYQDLSLEKLNFGSFTPSKTDS